MNRCTCALFLAVVMLIPVYVRAGLELEPNNSSAQAQVISFGKSVSETLSSNQDEDWSVVYVPASGLIGPAQKVGTRVPFFNQKIKLNKHAFIRIGIELIIKFW